MKYRVLRLFLIVLFIFPGCVQGQQVQGQQVQGQTQQNPGQKDPVIITATCDRKYYFLLEPIPVNVTIKNISDKKFTFFYNWESGIGPYTISATDDSGKDIPLTDYGKSYNQFAANPPKMFGFSAPLNSDLTPGREMSERIIISRFVDLTNVKPKNGRYSTINISISRYGVTAAPLAVRILTRLYDLSDRDVKEAIDTGKFNGDSIK